MKEYNYLRDLIKFLFFAGQRPISFSSLLNQNASEICIQIFFQV